MLARLSRRHLSSLSPPSPSYCHRIVQFRFGVLVRWNSAGGTPPESGDGESEADAKKHRILVVEVVGARELQKPSLLSLTPDPYVKLRLGNVEIQTTVQKDTLNPLWGTRYDFTFDNVENAILELTLNDYNIGFSDGTFGTVMIPLSLIEEEIQKSQADGEREWQTWFPLRPPHLQGSHHIVDRTHYADGRVYLNFRLMDWEEWRKLKAPVYSSLLPHALPVPKDSITVKKSVWESGAQLDRRRRFRILSLDGGGVRGIFSVTMLHRLIEKYPTLLDEIDMIAGTSTGGILGMLLAAGYSTSQCQAIYGYHCPQIFASNVQRRYSPFKSKYDDTVKLDIFKKYLGDRTMENLTKWLLVLAFKLDGSAPGHIAGRKSFFPPGSWRPAMFSNIPRAYGFVDPDLEASAVDVAMKTSAAPTYFPPYKGYVDGGVFANNPSQAALVKIRTHFPQATLENIVILSVGTGNYPTNIRIKDDERLDWGLRQWGPHLLSLLLESAQRSIDYNLGMLLRERYHRLDPDLPRRVALDSVEDIADLVSWAEKVDLSATEAFVRDVFLDPKESMEAHPGAEDHHHHDADPLPTV